MKTRVQVFTSADQTGSKADIRSTWGYETYLLGNLVTCRSKKQIVVTTSSAEAEFRALTLGLWERLWLRTALKKSWAINYSFNHNML